MALLDRGTHRIHWETHGDPARPPLLLIMGLALSSRAWDRLPEHLSRDFHVLVSDTVATGRPGPRVSYRMPHLAPHARAVLDAAGVEKACVFGISMGGMI